MKEKVYIETSINIYLVSIAHFHQYNFPLLCTPIEMLGGYNEL